MSTPATPHTSELATLRLLHASLQSTKLLFDGILTDLETTRANHKAVNSVTTRWGDAIEATATPSTAAKAGVKKPFGRT